MWSNRQALRDRKNTKAFRDEELCLDHALCAARNLLVRDCNIADAVLRGDAERVKSLSNGTYTVAVIGKSVNTF